MPIFVPEENLAKNESFGQLINQVVRDYIDPELKKRGRSSYAAALIEIGKSAQSKVHLDDEIRIILDFKDRKINPGDVGKSINVDLKEIKDVSWDEKTLDRNTAKILVVRFSQKWWILKANFKKQKDLEDKFKVNRTFRVRGGGYLPLNIKRQEKEEFSKQWRGALGSELPAMWRRHITISQRYRGVMVYDGNYFDLFSHAQELFVFGYYYSTIILCRTAVEQAVISILVKSGLGLEVYKSKHGKQKMKSIEDLVATCRSHALHKGKYPINKSAAKKLNEISTIAGDLVHPKKDLGNLDAYKKDAIKCMDNLQYVIKNHLNFVKDTGVLSGYRIGGPVKRLR